ncbi:MAG: PIN domain-containing protein [Methylacidiphilales bacterium]|nr:PIN domain-containing protein [Candidatus Methylacidiphilales bacterium]
MSATRFLDTNILLYAYDIDAPVKRAVALRLVEQAWMSPGETAISVQVLQEMHVNLEKRGVPRVEAGLILRDYAQWPVVDNTLDLLLAAVNEQVRWKISLWDALIIAAARASGATELISEDLSHGQDYGGVRVINPFR